MPTERIGPIRWNPFYCARFDSDDLIWFPFSRHVSEVKKKNAGKQHQRISVWLLSSAFWWKMSFGYYCHCVKHLCNTHFVFFSLLLSKSELLLANRFFICLFTNTHTQKCRIYKQPLVLKINHILTRRSKSDDQTKWTHRTAPLIGQSMRKMPKIWQLNEEVRIGNYRKRTRSNVAQ